MSDAEPALRIRSLSRIFDDGSGLRPTDLDVQSGEFVSLLGPSGCGKSTFLRCLAGLETPQTGSIILAGRPVFDLERRIATPPRGRGLGMVFQDLALWPHLSVFENVAFPLRVSGRRGAEVTSRVTTALERVGLEDSAAKQPHQLSGGQQQRVAIARAIVGEPALLLMDEPLSALDAALRQRLRGELRALTRELGLTTVYVTHDQSEAMSMSDRIVVMKAGSVRQVSSPEDLYRSPVDTFVADFVGAFNRLPGGGDQVRGVRPESVRIVEDRAAGALRATVLDSSYDGGGHVLGCAVDGVERPWIVRSRHPYAPGTELMLAIDDDEAIDTRLDEVPAQHHA